MVQSDESARDSIAATFREVERTGMRLAIRGRLVAIVVIGVWLIASRPPSRIGEFLIALSAFAALGLLHYAIIGSDADRRWVKYVFITADLALLTLAILLSDPYPTADLPDIIIFRFESFPFYFLALAVAAFSFSPGLLVWTGAAGSLAWLAAYGWVAKDAGFLLDWTDLPDAPTRAQFYALFFSPDFAPIGSRIQEAVLFLTVAVLIATVMRRARSTVRRQYEAERDRAAISQIFGRYVPEAVVSAMIADRGALSPVERRATILFADLADFTRMTGAAGARGTVDVINEFFEATTAIIGRHHGVVTQFQGDALLASFNLPVEDADHARHAVRAAQDILAAVHGQRFGGRDLTVRIGIATGNVMAGNIGGGGRQSYTVYGDAVNLAARLQELNKDYGTSVLFPESTADMIAVTAVRPLGAATVRGVEAPVTVYTLQG